MDHLLLMLHSISTKLDETELGNLKFLCREIIGKRKLESIKSTNDLFTCLIELTEISDKNLDFLKKLLKGIKRQDLVQEVGEFQENQLGVNAEPEPLERSQLEQAFDIVCENVGHNWKMVIRRLGVSDTIIDGIVYANPYNMQEQKMQCLRHWGKQKRGQAQVSDLIQVLRSCKMCLVAERVMEELQIHDS
ncbi:FAS-associated death domain protein [Discoglossus pictus]